MSLEQRTCQNCKSDFSVSAADFDLYSRLGVPAPTFCWKCRLARRLVWRNERSLCKRKCDLCNRDIISMFRPDVPFPVYCHECWLSDKWSPLDYGRDYDFSKSFFEQFAELQKVVPRDALYSSQNINSDYCNFTARMKNSYLMFGSWFCEDSGYGQTVLESKDCWDCLYLSNCESCFSSSDCEKCYKTHFSQNCLNCSDSAFLFDCKNCQNCLFSYNLRSKSYYVFNKPVSKEEYQRVLKEITGSYSELQKYLDEFRRTVADKALHKFYTGEQNQDVSGDFIYNARNIRDSYYIHDAENLGYAVRCGNKQKDGMDLFGCHTGELLYENNSTDFSSRSRFCIFGENLLEADYAVDCFVAEHVFGCISLKKGKYSILNKQYSEEEYVALRERIIAQMKEKPYLDRKGRSYGYGELFPMELAPFAYNETIAQEWFPVTQQVAKDLGYEWLLLNEKDYVETMSWRDLPETLAEVNNEITSQTILCRAWEANKQSAQEHKCTKVFRITPDELLVYRKFGVPLPRECPNTRNFVLGRLRNPLDFYRRSCQCVGIGSSNGAYANTSKSHQPHSLEQACPNEFVTTYVPDRPEIVYCEQCYQAEVA